MLKYTIRSFIGLIPTIFVIVTLSFFITRWSPGNPFDQARALPPAVKADLEAQYGLDKPVVVQYGIYLFHLLEGNLGRSFQYRDQTINGILSLSFPVSLSLGVMSFIFCLIFGILLGLFSGLRNNSWIDYSTSALAIIGVAIPSFVIGPLLVYILALKLHWLPTSGWPSGFTGWSTVILPIISLGLYYLASIARVFRASVIEIKRSDFVTTAKAKGLSNSKVIFRHILKPSLLPVVTYLGPVFTNLITGSIVIEQIFRIPGMGQDFVNASFNRDYSLVMGIVIIYALILVSFNFIVDIIYGFLDPRISYN